MEAWKGMAKCIFKTPHYDIKCVLNIEESNFNEEKDQIFTFAYGQGPGPRGLTPAPPLRSAWP